MMTSSVSPNINIYTASIDRVKREVVANVVPNCILGFQSYRQIHKGCVPVFTDLSEAERPLAEASAKKLAAIYPYTKEATCARAVNRLEHFISSVRLHRNVSWHVFIAIETGVMSSGVKSLPRYQMRRRCSDTEASQQKRPQLQRRASDLFRSRSISIEKKLENLTVWKEVYSAAVKIIGPEGEYSSNASVIGHVLPSELVAASEKTEWTKSWEDFVPNGFCSSPEGERIVGEDRKEFIKNALVLAFMSCTSCYQDVATCTSHEVHDL